MNEYDIFKPSSPDGRVLIPHLPLDWNEHLSLEEYLERMERRRARIEKSCEALLPIPWPHTATR
ncbi:hypothetical protein GGR26_000460 [Lewinella marina]|uniref:hypothetical protein n=1 Tax=Neolewinella marina TaxID=438751 RepID=UPI00117ABABB|nr:hypothetical protein [Neolewinella marina]NJB84715.1 hypothetical protein [Neolewinella marina]